MARCIRCEKLRRIHRNWWQRLRYAAVYECAECHSQIGEPRTFTYRLSRNARCPRCGTHDLRKLPRRDHIESMSWHPLSLIQGLLFAQLYLCPLCRLQFYDFRRRLEEKNADAAELRTAPDHHV